MVSKVEELDVCKRNIKEIKEKHKHTFLKLSIGFAIVGGILRETDPYVASVFVLFSGYFLIRSD